jgi:hypothetical protein
VNCPAERQSFTADAADKEIRFLTLFSAIVSMMGESCTET